MNRKQLPRENEICYVTIKIDTNTEIEELGYLTSYPVEPSKFKEELGYYDERMDLFRHLTVTVPIIEWDFSIDNLVSWRGVNEWISVEDRLPEPHKTVLVINREGYFPAAIRSDGQFHLPNLAWVYGITHWQPLPPRPLLTKAA